jgi:hypothetical protein
MDVDPVVSQLPHLSPIQATLQGPSPSIRHEAASRNDEKRYDDRPRLEGFAVRAAWLEAFSVEAGG